MVSSSFALMTKMACVVLLVALLVTPPQTGNCSGDVDSLTGGGHLSKEKYMFLRNYLTRQIDELDYMYYNSLRNAGSGIFEKRSLKKQEISSLFGK